MTQTNHPAEQLTVVLMKVLVDAVNGEKRNKVDRSISGIAVCRRTQSCMVHMEYGVWHGMGLVQS